MDNENQKPLSSSFLKSNGKCCCNGCINCPYYPKHIGSELLRENILVCNPMCSEMTIKSGLCECFKNG